MEEQKIKQAAKEYAEGIIFHNTTFPTINHIYEAWQAGVKSEIVKEMVREEAVAFARWISKNDYEPLDEERWFIYLGDDKTIKTTAELYSIFKEENK